MTQAQFTGVLTRPSGRNTGLLNALERRGWSMLECPALEIREVFAGTTPVPSPECFDLVVFVSRAAVTGYHSQLSNAAVSLTSSDSCIEWPIRTRAACMGPVTAGAIRRVFGNQVSIIHPDGAQAQDSESLWPLLLELEQPLEKVLIVRGQDGRDWLSQRLIERNVQVTLHQAYQRQVAQWPQEIHLALLTLAQKNIHPTWLLTSPHGLDAIFNNLQSSGLIDWFGKCPMVLTHERLRPQLSKLLDRPSTQLETVMASPEDEVILACFEQIARQHRASLPSRL